MAVVWGMERLGFGGSEASQELRSELVGPPLPKLSQGLQSQSAQELVAKLHLGSYPIKSPLSTPFHTFTVLLPPFFRNFVFLHLLSGRPSKHYKLGSTLKMSSLRCHLLSLALPPLFSGPLSLRPWLQCHGTGSPAAGPAEVQIH